MSRYDARPNFETAIARLHLMTALDRLGPKPRGVYIVTVPGTIEAEHWYPAAVAIGRELRDAKTIGGIDVVFEDEDDKTQSALEAVMLTSDGLYTGFVGARCQLYLTEEGHADLDHPSVRLADGILNIEMQPELVAQAAAEHGRAITLEEAALLAGMPRKARRLAFASPRSITESIELHEIAAVEEAKLAAAEKEPKNKSKDPKLPARVVPDVPPLEELHGYGEAKTWGLELARDVADYTRGDIEWKDVNNALLLVGPPGTGKTTYASSLARTLDAHLVVGSYSTWIANGEGHQGDLIKGMRNAFEEARKYAPAVILIDEIDNFLQRGSIGHGKSDEWMRGVVNSLLECMDGAIAREGVVVIGATNNASGIDAALLRSGRLDRTIEIGLPDRDARLAILAQHLGVGEEFPLNRFGRLTAGMSGADLERLARDARRIARRAGTELKHSHVAQAFPRREARTPEEIRHVAVHEAGHAVVAAALGATVQEVVVRLDRDPNVEADVAGYAAIEARSGRRDYRWYADRAAHILGGLAGEKLIYGDHADGVLIDLSEASNLLTYAITSLGMGDTLLSDGHRGPDALSAARKFDAVLCRRVEDLLQEQLLRALGIVERHRPAFEELVEVLIQRGRLDGDVVHETLRAHAPVQLSLAV